MPSGSGTKPMSDLSNFFLICVYFSPPLLPYSIRLAMKSTSINLSLWEVKKKCHHEHLAAKCVAVTNNAATNLYQSEKLNFSGCHNLQCSA